MENEKFRLCRAFVPAWAAAQPIASGCTNWKDIKLVEMSRSCFLSRHLAPLSDISKAERISIYHPDLYLVADGLEEGSGKYIYEFDDKLVAHPVAPLNDCEEVFNRFVEANKCESTVAQLSGAEPETLAHADFANGDELNILAYNEAGDGYILAKHDFIREALRIDVVDVKEDGSLAVREIPYDQTIYRTTMKSPNSYINVPKGQLYIISNKATGRCQLYRNGDYAGTKVEHENMDDLLAANKADLVQSASMHKDIPQVDLYTCDLYITRVPAAEADDFVTPYIFRGGVN